MLTRCDVQMDNEKARTLAKEFANMVAREIDPDWIALYGSTLNGTRQENSDIDIAVIFDEFNGDWRATFARLVGFTEHVGYSVEPILLNMSTDKSGFAHEILSTGEILFQKKVAPNSSNSQFLD